jgi:hypothetical protein
MPICFAADAAKGSMMINEHNCSLGPLMGGQ